MPQRNFIYDNTGDHIRTSPSTSLDDVISLNGGVIMNGQPCKVARGQFTSVSASDTIVTGLKRVYAVVASLDSDPGLDPGLVSASVGDQVATPVAGSIILKSWKFTNAANPTPIAATTFAKKINWIAIGE
jgi:hypothetical protein